MDGRGTPDKHDERCMTCAFGNDVRLVQDSIEAGNEHTLGTNCSVCSVCVDGNRWLRQDARAWQVVRVISHALLQVDAGCRAL